MTREPRAARLRSLLEGQLSQTLLWAPICLGVGIYIFFALRFEPGFGVAWICLGCALLGFWAAIRFRLTRFPSLLCALVLVGFLSALFRTHDVSHTVLGWRYYGTVEGTVAFVDRSRSEKPRLTLIDPVMPPISAARTPARIRVSLFGSDTVPEIGTRIRIEASFSPPSGPVEPQGYDFRRRAWFQELGAVGYARKDWTQLAPTKRDQFALHLAHVRRAISAHIRGHMSDRAGGFAAALLVGDRAFVDQTALENLRRSNMAHLLAISGLHMGLLTGFVFALMRVVLVFLPHYGVRWSSKKIAAVGAILAGFTYLILSGSAVATERAFIMVTMMFGAILLDRPALTLRAVAMAAVIILLFWPENLLEPGFQMSFAATIALVVVFRWIKDMPTLGDISHHRFLRNGFALVLSSAIAGFATAPFAAYHFNQIAHYGILANTLSLPLMGAIIMPFAIIAALLHPVGLDWLGFWVMEHGINWILKVAEWVAGFENAISLVPQAPPVALPIIVISCLLTVLLRGWGRCAVVPGVLVAIWMWSLAERPNLLVTDNGRMVGVQMVEGRALNRKRGNGFAAGNWSENDGMPFDQEKQAALFGGNPDAFVHVLGGAEIYYVWDAKLEQGDLDRLCARFDVVISPKSEIWADGTCTFWNKYKLRRDGALAFIDKGGMQIKTARQSSGARLWTDYKVRKAFNRSE
ncbi:MAG: ComEC/Rec2 family competence protein [Pseudomonadota bacterium]